MFGSQSTVAPSEHVSVVDYVAAFVGGKKEQNNNPDVMASVWQSLSKCCLERLSLVASVCEQITSLNDETKSSSSLKEIRDAEWLFTANFM